LVLGKSSM